MQEIAGSNLCRHVPFFPVLSLSMPWLLLFGLHYLGCQDSEKINILYSKALKDEIDLGDFL